VASADSFSRRSRVRELGGVATAFDGMVERLKDAAAAIRQGAEDHAHAFKTPIAVIAQSLEPLRRGVASVDERGRRAVEMIERSVARLDELVAATRRIDQAIALSVDPPRQKLDLSTLVTQLVEDYRDAAQVRGAVIAIECEPGVAVLAGEDLLESIVENLLDNAIDFSPPGGTIEVRVRREGRRAVLTVADQGPGVPPDQLSRLFPRYYTRRPQATQAAGGRGNSGLGLWIVKRNIRSIGGEVLVANRPQGGFSVRIEAPLA
jgi:two-component system sensor histidine kinase ChvG